MRARGFTLMELLLVLTLMALLASVAVPVVTGSVQRAKESTLKENLFAMRKAIDDYYADNGGYPAELELLEQKRYLRKIPADPLTDRRDSWILVRTDDESRDKGSGIIDVRSGSEEQDGNGVPYKEW
jgi:general secretion pathway protein G